MKRVKVTALVPNNMEREVWNQVVLGVGEIERYEEKEIPKEATLETEMSFDSLMEGAMEFGQGIWLIVKGLGKLSFWAVVTIFEGVKWLWKKGAGSKDEERKKEIMRKGAAKAK